MRSFLKTFGQRKNYLRIRKELVFFSNADLEALGVDRRSLEPFILPREFRKELANIPICRSPLHVFPLLSMTDGVAFVLPGAVTFAIRMYLTQQLVGGGYHAGLVRTLKSVYEQFLNNVPLLPYRSDAELEFTDDQHPTAEALYSIDLGRYVHLLCVLDNLDRVKSTGVGGASPVSTQLNSLMQRKCEAAMNYARKQRDFRGGITLLVVCGVGRGVCTALPKLDGGWEIYPIAAPDLLTLAWTHEFTLLRLWKCLEAVRSVRELGVEFVNPNGLLNLVAWMQSNGWQVLPHSEIPKGFRSGSGVIQLPTNCLLKLRVNTAQQSDHVGISLNNSDVVECRRVTESLPTDDTGLPVYIPITPIRNGAFPFVVVSGACSWWCDATTSSSSRSMLHERWMMLKVWVPRVASAIERHADRLPSSVYIVVDFLALSDMGPITEIPDEAEIRQSISADLHREEGVIALSVGEAFERGLQDVSNVAERILVSELCGALLDLFSIEVTDETIQRLLTQIVPNDAARYVHAFYASQFRDFVSPSLRGQIIESDELDSAILRSGLAFCVESRTKGRFSTRSKRQATQFLNSLVQKLESELIAVCQSLDRNQLLEQALWNHERAVQSRQRWMRHG
ncbi:MAG UNVERIFIED_CONTAM: hypothetical protein LVR18_20150 [Planctomycetaceae bacterium]